MRLVVRVSHITCINLRYGGYRVSGNMPPPEWPIMELVTIVEIVWFLIVIAMAFLLNWPAMNTALAASSRPKPKVSLTH